MKKSPAIFDILASIPSKKNKPKVPKIIARDIKIVFKVFMI